MHKIIRESRVPVILDADGIYAVSMNIDILKEVKSEIIMTPHPGEFSRLVGLSVAEINDKRVELAKNFAEKCRFKLY